MEGSHEKEFPESANMQGSGEILFSLEPFFILSSNEIFILIPVSLAKEERTQNQL